MERLRVRNRSEKAKAQPTQMIIARLSYHPASTTEGRSNTYTKTFAKKIALRPRSILNIAPDYTGANLSSFLHSVRVDLS